MDRECQIQLVTNDGVKLDAKIRHAGLAGSVLLVHGFGVDLHEEGAFDTLALSLAVRGLSSLRFSFRGHGSSDGRQSDVTVQGERSDFATAYQELVSRLPPPYGIVAASFGAVSTLLEIARLTPRPTALVLWNPVVDVHSVFINPTTPWGRANFGQRALELARTRGSVIAADFEVSRELFENWILLEGNLGLQKLLGQQTLVLHGSNDSYVPVEASRLLASLPGVQYQEIQDSDHGFPEPENEELVIAKTVEWLSARIGSNHARSNPDEPV